MNDNIAFGNKLAGCFNKQFGVATYSGTLALESALVCAGIKNKDKVVVSGAVCNAVLNAIVRAGAMPVVVISKDKIKLEANELLKVLKKEKNIKCVVLVHQYGIVHDIAAIRKYCGNKIPIIEDVAQAYNIVVNGCTAGRYSDYVITSFGKTKPLNYGIGGAVFSSKSISDKFDFEDNESRERKGQLLPYAYPNCENINLQKLLKSGAANIKKQRRAAELLAKGLCNIKDIRIINDSDGNQSVWHRYPIFIKDKVYHNKILRLLDKAKVLYQLPHIKDAYELAMFKDNIIIHGDNDKHDSIILIRTRTNLSKNIKKFLSLLKKDAD
jgi:dTDP-4-amino-4,6-dideoxygalactose transaminase